MRGPIPKFLVGAPLTGLASLSKGAEATDSWCRPDMNSLVRLETMAKESDPSGISARSALKTLVEEKLPTSDYFITKNPVPGNGAKVQYHLYHESGFSKPCVAGNQSGFDGVLDVDPSTNEVKSFLFWQ
jgi:hypothetical protein